VFPQEAVNRLDIVIAADEWQAMLDNMTDLYGDASSRSNVEGGGNAARPERGQAVAGEVERERPEPGVGGGERPERGQGGEGGGGGNANLGSSENPMFGETQVFFNGTQWYNVGLRFKGNSSLSSAWQSGTLKLPFKMDFDEFEDDYPELKNQRFYGFKQLSFSSGYSDASLMREKLAAESFEAAGIAAPKTAFYELYIDYGEGPTYFGLYTAVEVVDDTLTERVFGDDSGNIYKAEGTATNLSAQTAASLKEGFVKKSNEDEDDWSDLEALSAVLNSDTRTTDPTQWKKDLEAVFDTSAFLNWLAVNTVIKNWDTYGAMTHNYYLYNVPETNLLTWIPWDNNESFSEGKRSNVTLTFNSINDTWPLIRYLIDDEAYRAEYVGYVNSFVENILETDAFTTRVEFLHELITPSVVGENGEQAGFTLLRNQEAFVASADALLAYVDGRIEAASNLSLESDWSYNASSTAQGFGAGVPPENGEFGFPPDMVLPDNWDTLTEAEQMEYMDANRPAGEPPF
jgi:hypothetical protein